MSRNTDPQKLKSMRDFIRETINSDVYKNELNPVERRQLKTFFRQKYEEAIGRANAPDLNEVKAYEDTEAQFAEENRNNQGVIEKYLTAPVQRGLARVGTGMQKLVAFGLDVIGADESADALLSRAEGQDETVQATIPGLGKNISEMTLGDVPQFATDTILENLPLMLATAGAGQALTGAKVLGSTLTPNVAGGAATYGLMSLPEMYSSVKEAGGGAGMAAAFAVPHAIIENLAGITPARVAKWFTKEGVAKGGTSYIYNALKASLGEGSEEVAQSLTVIAAKHFSTKPFSEAMRAFVDEVKNPATIQQMKTEFAGGAIFGLAGGGFEAAIDKLTAQINDPKTTPEEAQKLAAAKKQLKDEMLQLTYNQNIPTVQPSGPIIKDPTVESFLEPEGELIHPQQTFGGPAPEVLYPDAQPPQNIGTEGTMRDYAVYKQDKQATIEEQNATPIAVLRKIAAMKSVPDSDPQKQRFMKFLAERNWLPQEATEYPAGRVGQELQALDAAEMMPETLVSAEATPETPLLPYQPNQAEGRILADNGGVILPTKAEDIIMPKSGRPFANQKIAKAYQAKNEMKDTHDITPVRGGFALMRKPTQQATKRITVETPRGGTYDKMNVRTEKNIPTEKRTRFTGTPGVAERIEKRLTPQAIATEEFADQATVKQSEPVAEQKPAKPVKQPASNSQYSVVQMSDGKFKILKPDGKGYAIGTSREWAEEIAASMNKSLVPAKTVTKNGYKVESYQGGYRVLDPEGKQYSWHTVKQAAEDKAREMNGTAKKIAEVKQSKKSDDGYKEKTQTIAEIVQAQLASKQKININELMSVANEVFEGTQANGDWNIKDLYDSMELGINLHLLRDPEYASLFNEGKITEFVEKVKKEILENIPTQTKRTEEMDEFQQFSTPPSIASLAAWLANINKNDSLLEPSAGIGGLAIFGKMAGAKVVVNEFSQRRAEILSNLPFDQFFTENGEQINNILPDDVAPTVVVMNPPFSSTAGRVQGERKTKNGGVHVEQALKRLQPGGRLVAIVGQGMSFEHSTFRDWWNKIRKEYNVLANVGLSGQEYKKYGTTFDNRILVIDKTGATTGQPVSGDYNNIESMIDALQGVRNVRQAIHGRAETGKSNADKPQSRGNAETDKKRNGGRPSDGSSIRTSEGNAVIENISKEHDDFKADKRSGLPGNVGTNGDISTAENNADPRPDASIQGRRESSNESGDTGRHDALSSGQSLQLDGSEKLEVTQSEQVKSEDLSDSIYDEYRPSVTVQGAKKHPGKLVESAAMAAVQPAKVNYTPKIPAEAVKAGKISDAQLESVIRAGNNHNQKLMDGKRKGFFIGDGTGVGKGREISAIFWDNFLQGRKKGVWVTKNSDLFKDARRDIEGIGWDKSVAFELKDYDDIKQSEGVLLISYDTLKGKSKDGRTRLEQINKWLGEDFDGVIAFDEAHMMANSVSTKATRGIKKPSERALKGFDFRQSLPNARTLYVSATGATEPSNLGYLERLGLWGAGTAFSNVNSFISEITSGGVAAMEMIAADMKAMGNYIARSLSFDGVTYGRLSHDLSPEQRKIYSTYCQAWQIVLQNVHEALAVCGAAKSGKALSAAKSAFWNSNQRFFNQILTSFQMPTLLKDIDQQLKAGKSIILQLTNTNEAQLKRQLDTLEDGELEDLDLTPTEIISQFVQSSFPVAQMEEYTDENGNKRVREVRDSNGNTVLNREAVAMREKLLDELGSIRKIDGPLDMILNHFGPDAVAEITGRTTRVVWRERDGTTKRVKENRSKRHSEAEENDFMSGKKRILVFSEAGGTGRSFHADMSKKNQQHRIHYLVQAGWRADAAIQGLGRSHRTNEASQPHYVLCSTDVPAQVRFTSTIARRLDQLGALTRGQRQTGGQGIFQARDNLENEYAQQAIHGFLLDLANQGSIGDLTFAEFEKQSGLDLRDDLGFVSANSVAAVPVRQFLNRTLSLDLPVQELVYSEVFTRLDEIVKIAEANGTLDIGMETIRAKSIVEKRGEVVRVDEESGAKTEYHLLETEHDAQYNKFPGSDGEFVKGYYHNEKTGRLIAIVSDVRSKYADGDVNENYFAALAPASYGDVTESNLAKNYKKITVAEASKLWQEQLNSLPKTIKKPLHLITGTLLPIWDRLPNSHVKIMRAKTDSGKVLLGRTVHPKAIDKVLKSLGVGGNTYSSAEAVAAILENGDEAELANGWKLKRKTVSGEKRIEIVGPDIGNREELDIAGVFSERIQYQTRFFIPKDKAVEVIEKLTKNRPITGLGAPTQASDPLYSVEYLVARYAKKGLNNAATIVKKGFDHIRSGLTQFAKWARQMVNEFGQAVKKHLRSLFKDLSDFNKRLGRTGAISGRPASAVTGKTTGQVLERKAQMKDFQWKKENFRTVHLEYTSPDTGKVTRVAKLLKVNNKWFWADAKREFLTLATAAKTVKSEIFEKVRNTEREQVKHIEEARARRTAKQAKAVKKVEAYLSQPSAAEEVTKKELPVTVADKISTYADRVTRALFDRRLMLKKVQKLIELVSGKKLPDWANPYDRFDVIDGRIETNKGEFKDKYWQPIMADLDKAKISYEDFNNFVYAMHAPERNKYINEINPGFREKGVAGSGWSNEKAAQVKAELFAKYGEDTLMEAGKKFWAMHSELLNKQVEYGLIDEEIKGIIDAKYKYYTPLKRIKDDTVILDARALGRRSEAQDQLMFSLAAINTTFGRGEHNRVMQAFARMALLNPADQFYEIQKDKLKPYFDERTGEVQYRLDLWADRENTIHAKFGGRDVAIVIKDKDLLTAIKIKKSEAEPLFQVLRPINRILSAVNTTFNPDFILTNIFRDIQTAAVHASDAESWEMAKGILASVPGSVKTSWQYHRGIDNENTRMYKEFLREGGKTGYSEIYQLQSLAEKLEKEMAERQANGAWYKTKQGIGKFMDVVSAGNDIAESATRFAGYQAARKSGMTAQKAAVFAKNLTINFNKKGTYGTLVNTLYVFGNAALQGSHLTARLTWNMAKTNKGRIALASMIALGAMSDFLNRLRSDFDDEEGRSYYDKISSDIKDNNFIVMLPGTGGNYMSFPMAYGLNILPSLGRNASSYLFGDQTLRETAMNILGVGMGAFNPMGNDNRGLLANLTPTALKPLHDLTTNTKWSGRKIRPDQPVFGADLPQSELYFDQTSKPLVKFTQWLNEAFGGNKYESSSFLTDISPADMQHLIEAFSGGVGKTIVRGVDTIGRVASGEPLQVENVPVIRRFVGKARDFNVYDEFRANAQIAKRFETAKSDNDKEWLNNNREYAKIDVMFKNVQKAIKNLMKNKSLSDEARKEKQLLLQKRFNKNVRGIMQKNLSKN